MKNLIVNADDLGWTPGVNRGIAEAHRNGIVTSTSLLANGSAFGEAVELAAFLPDLGVGVHLNLTDGAPCAPRETVAALLSPSGEFQDTPENLMLKIVKGALDLRAIEREWDAQIVKIRAGGVKPTHLDGHKHVHMLPGCFDIALRLAKRHAIPAIRVSHESSTLRSALASADSQPSPVVLKQGLQARGLKLIARKAHQQAERAGIASADYFCGIAQTGKLSKNGVAQLLAALPEGTTEFMCHPGYADDQLRQSPTRLRESRQTELAILTNPEIRNLVAAQGIRLIHYGFLASEA